MRRKPYVAGQFYPSDPGQLQKELDRLCPQVTEKEDAIALISPHAGYVYSGGVAGSLYAGVRLHDTCIILCPNHSGMGEKCAIMSRGSWTIPFGEIAINEHLADLIKNNSGIVAEDYSAHTYEHSLEVQLPFIYHFKDTFDFVPIALKSLSVEECRQLGMAIAKSVVEYEKDVTLVASTDMTHYEPDAVAREKDSMAIERILQLDPQGLYTTVRDRGISMCGYIPTTVVIHGAVELGARSANLVKYATSGEVSGDFQQVVGYAGIYLK
ncbi:MAG: AmmeMemoRadiSam system protein B [Deltaproteobacteria bacterium]|nr:AmmeMemoRadiSam system protein B [Deltaproteobacteria bacterium]NIS78150.1 AmmeMemoRadiSam system protein B [Deltaproteobacteria bacterium]